VFAIPFIASVGYSVGGFTKKHFGTESSLAINETARVLSSQFRISAASSA
jgi:predicted alpha/beta-fold hydrolase